MKRTLILVWSVTLLVALSPFGTTTASPRCYPMSRFAVLSDNVVRDTLTQIVWQRDGSGTRAGCSGVGNSTCTWAEAEAYCGTITLDGLSGWRLPTVKELRSIVDYTVGYPGPTINQIAFPNTPAENFWTSSQSAGPSSEYAWDVAFISGSSTNPWVGYYDRVRCVR